MRAHLAARYQTGDPDTALVDLDSMVCECGGVIDPILGKVHEGTKLLWDVWAGAYEHRVCPSYPHAPQPVAPATWLNTRPLDGGVTA